MANKSVGINLLQSSKKNNNENGMKEIVPRKYKHTTYATKIRVNHMIIYLNVKI
jgi:hypothetical protein